MRRTALLSVVLTFATAAAVPVMSGTAHADPTPLVDTYKDWILQTHDGVRNGLRRDLNYVYGPTLVVNGSACTQAAPCVVGGPTQSTAACKSLRFLSVYFAQRAAYESRSLSSIETGVVDEFATAVLAYRSPANPATPKIFDEAIASALGSGTRYYTSFGNAACGEALLAAYEVTGDPDYLTAATGIGEFLLRMQDPRAYYAAYGAHPFVDATGAPTTPPGGYVDQISSASNLYATISTWNLTAVSFLQRLETVVAPPDNRYADSADLAVQFLYDGLDLGADWYTFKFDSPVTAQNRIVAASSYSANCQDNRWHRKGSCAYTTTGEIAAGTLGTDMIEYGLAALYDYKHQLSGATAAATAVADLYERYTRLPGYHTASAKDPLDCVDDTRAGAVDPYYPPDNQGATPSGDVWDYDPHLSFGGFFRLGTTTNNAEAKYYDIVGFGILARVRDALVPAKFAHGYARLDATDRQDALFALLDRTLERMYLPGADSDDFDGDGDVTESICTGTRGTLPNAVNGLGILDTLGYAGTR
ncbi:hypothetical protein GCM10010399_11870 [Dactylosporangium fulvum]|uniref:Uncharacterized protein n=1 Tax=Dactylosporangium fulvum TaxID=53359 RepID=A0ABY5W2W3_9ACTN|nr:hypothetical protein [Dactylosporangium fulvum]UWP84398.1 hypothetical protein Dfulv_09235 [Dactylosporangium fulvum]